MLDWIGDIGGVEAALLIFFGVLYRFVHFKSFDNFLVQKLYRTKKDNGDES